MGSMMKADSDRRELMRERRQARIERKQQRRDARERKQQRRDARERTRAHISEAPPALSPMQRAGQERVDAAVDRIVSVALERHDQVAATASATNPANATPPTAHLADARARSERPTGPTRATSGSDLTGDQANGGPRRHVMAAVKPAVGGSERRHAGHFLALGEAAAPRRHRKSRAG